MRNFLSQTNSFVALEVVTYSTSIMESTMQDCFKFLLLIVALSEIKTKLKVDLRESL